MSLLLLLLLFPASAAAREGRAVSKCLAITLWEEESWRKRVVREGRGKKW